MSENAAKQLFESLVALAPGVKNFVPQVGAEIRRHGIQGSMEIVSGMNTGQWFVPYGPGQYTPDGHGVHGPEQEHSGEHQQEMAQEQSHEQDRDLGLER